jgi:hypothetical protein
MASTSASGGHLFFRRLQFVILANFIFRDRSPLLIVHAHLTLFVITLI